MDNLKFLMIILLNEGIFLMCVRDMDFASDRICLAVPMDSYFFSSFYLFSLDEMCLWSITYLTYLFFESDFVWWYDKFEDDQSHK